jgi:hypothetical protein
VVAVLYSPYEWPVTGENLNCIHLPFPRTYLIFMLIIIPDAPVIMGGVTIFALISYWVMPEEAWLPRNRISHFIKTRGEGAEGTAAETEQEEEGVTPK